MTEPNTNSLDSLGPLCKVIHLMAAELGKIDSLLINAQTLTDLLIPLDCYKMWGERAGLWAYLQQTENVCVLREKALVKLKELGSVETDEQWRAYYQKKGIAKDSYVIERYFALSNYLTATWALYDRLANVCGRLIGPVSIGANNNQQRNPKLFSSFIETKQFLNKAPSEIGEFDCEEDGGGKKDGKKDANRPDGFSLGKVLPTQWGWPVFVSYRLRNLVVHDGAGSGGDQFFAADGIEAGLLIHEHLKKELLKSHFSGKSAIDFKSGLRFESEFPWYGDNLIKILEKYNGEIDELYERTLTWSVRAFCDQVRIFSQPDSKKLAMASVIAGRTVAIESQQQIESAADIDGQLDVKGNDDARND